MSAPKTQATSTNRGGSVQALRKLYRKLPVNVRDEIKRLSDDRRLWFLPGLVVGFWLGRRRRGGGEQLEGMTRKSVDGGEKGGKDDPPMGTPLKMVFIVRKDLGMSPGKAASQCAHGAVGMHQVLSGSKSKLLRRWEAQGQAKIVLSCRNHSEMVKLAASASRRRIPSYVVSDEGKTQVARGSQTVLVLGPGAASVVDEVTGGLTLL